jgi:hypothetical protein
MSMIRWSALSLVLGCGLFFGPTLPAQTVGGVAVDAGDRPVPGVVVLLLDTAARVAARSLTNERGEFRVTAARQARIGSARFALDIGQPSRDHV